MSDGLYLRKTLHQGAECKIGPYDVTIDGAAISFAAYPAGSAEVIAQNSDASIEITGSIVYPTDDSFYAVFSPTQTALVTATDELTLMVRVTSGTTKHVLVYGQLLPILEVA